MKKEVVLAIVIGFGIGLLITFGIYTARTAVNQADQQNQQASIQAPQIPDATSSAKLKITTPANHSLFDTDTISLEGKTTPEAILTIIGQEGQQIITADEDGNFNTELELSGGANQIKISSFSKDGEKTEITLTVVFSTAKI